MLFKENKIEAIEAGAFLGCERALALWVNDNRSCPPNKTVHLFG